MDTNAVLAAAREIAARLAAELAELDSQLAISKDVEAFYPTLADVLDRCLAALAGLGVWGPENRLPSSEIWNVAGQWLSRGWLQNQARTKPRGYAGDHEMLARIYEGTFCEDSLGRLFDRYFQAQAAPRAVRNRMRMMTQWIGEALRAGGPTKIAVVGSALGLEVRDALRAAPVAARQQLTVALLDLDPAAIEFARGQLESLLPKERLILQPANLFRLPERSRLAAPLAGSDWIFCPGLFDYLDDAAAVAMVRCLFGQVAAGGRLVVFQFAPYNPTRAYMEWLGNWYLTYRGREAFEGLFAAAGLQNAAIEFAAEPLGIDLYAKVTRRKSQLPEAV